jgi:hypothetical protein
LQRGTCNTIFSLFEFLERAVPQAIADSRRWDWFPAGRQSAATLQFNNIIDTSIIHDTLAVIANEVKQSSGFLSGLPHRPRRLAMTGGSGLPRRLRLLMELLANRLVKQLAIPLSNHKTVTKWLVISQQAGKPLIIAMTGIPEHASLSSNTETSVIDNFNILFANPL